MKPDAIAVVGVSGRFPGARNVHDFWRNLRDGVESIQTLTDSELLAAGATPEEIAQPEYVKRAAVLDDVDQFDAAFFGISPRDAAIMDPQHRHFLECAWEALEDAAHPPGQFNGSIGVFAGSGMSAYLIHNLLANRELVNLAGLFQLKQTGNDKDVLATRLSYQMDLRGPSISVQTACSTSLVAVHLACQSLLNNECDMALAGGVTIEIPHRLGYLYRAGEILSRDGHCRAFDASSTGTVFGSGLGIVVLRRLEDATADGDAIRAVILGSAINNDGARKVGYLAPSVDGQAEVIAEAMEFAGVTAEDITYIEAHGTGTIVGDPIEVRALTQAFRRSTQHSGFCALGSLKTNVGHLDAASGVAALIKTVLALQHRQLPASLHFNSPNPHIDFSNSPFYVNRTLKEWDSSGGPLRAGVTSLGIGGTNAHVVLEEAPARRETSRSRPYQLLTVSAKTANAADESANRLADFLHRNEGVNLADASYTCQVGRQVFALRRAWVAETMAGARDGMLTKSEEIVRGVAASRAREVAFLFPGQGSQYVNMGRELFECEPAFRESMDHCAEVLQGTLGLDLRDAIYPCEAGRAEAEKRLGETWLTQPAMFAVEYTMARWWMSVGVDPVAMLGHSIGEYVAACLGGVFTLEDALRVAAMRGKLMFAMPPGNMLAVALAEREVPLPDGVWLAAINGPDQCVVSGPVAAIHRLEQDLAMQSVACRRLATSHAYHSAMMDPILREFEEQLNHVPMHAPRIPFLSNVTGTWITKDEATDPAYWAKHLRSTVRFADSVAELLRMPEWLLLEVGPGNTLTTLVRQQSGATSVFHSLPPGRDNAGGLRRALHTLGQVWSMGVDVNWEGLHAKEPAFRVALPTYPFEHQRFWIDPDPVLQNAAGVNAPGPAAGEKLRYYRRMWKETQTASTSIAAASEYLVFNDGDGLGEEIARQLNEQECAVTMVDAGSAYKRIDERRYSIRPGVRADFDALVKDVARQAAFPRSVIHLWSALNKAARPNLDDSLEHSFLSPLFLAQALADAGITGVDIALVSNCMQPVLDGRVKEPLSALLLGPARVVPMELPGLSCKSIDLDLSNGTTASAAESVLAETCVIENNTAVAYRHRQRYVEVLEDLRLESLIREEKLETGGVYLITGGTGGLGLSIAAYLAREYRAKFVLVSRSAFGDEGQWETCANDANSSDADRERTRRLLEIRAAAGGLMVAGGDVTRLADMQGIVSAAVERFGRVDGVFHAAGVLDDGPLMLKSKESAMHVLEAKVHGTLVLDEVFRDTELRFFALFSSISSIYPAPGQVEYAAANAFLDAFASSRRGRVIAIDWGAWRNVGMTARGGQVHPLLEERLLLTSEERVYSSELAQRSQWVLAEHKLRSKLGTRALLPGAAYIEMAAGALMAGVHEGGFEVQDVHFLAPCMVDGDESRELQVQLKRHAHGKSGFDFAVISRQQDWVEHCSGSIASLAAEPAVTLDMAEIAARCKLRTVLFDEQHRTGQERLLEFGPRWRSLRRIAIGDGEALAVVELDPAFAVETTRFHLHPALLDLATGAAVYLTRNYDESGDLFLPISYKRMRVYSSLPSRFSSHIRHLKQNRERSEVESFDITIVDAQERVLVEIEGFSMRRIVDLDKALRMDAPGRDAVGERMDAPMPFPQRPTIEAEDGVRALARILCLRTPNVLVITGAPLGELQTNVTATAAKRATPPPPAQSEAGQTVEETIAGWWRDLLGVGTVAEGDDFFDLGGHSLVGVRFLAAVRRTYGVDLDLATLFEERTPARIAEVIRREMALLGAQP